MPIPGSHDWAPDPERIVQADEPAYTRLTWYPPPRSTYTGHRVPDQIGLTPVQTRDYPWWPWWPLELLMRIAARKINKLPERLASGHDEEQL